MIPHIVIDEERPKIPKQSSSSFEVSEITDKMDDSDAKSNQQQFRPLLQVLRETIHVKAAVVDFEFITFASNYVS